MNFQGLGGMGSGFLDMHMRGVPHETMGDWWNLMGAGGFGMGPYGYAAHYGGAPWSAQNMMLNQQWGLPRYYPGPERTDGKSISTGWPFGAHSPGR